MSETVELKMATPTSAGQVQELEATESELAEVPDVFEGEGNEGNDSMDNSTPVGSGKNSKSLAAFIAKLYSMVEDIKVQHLIHWNNSGGFLVVNPDEFAREVLPQYFKHNNFASFVRQLNMYGFHKVNDFVQQGPEQQHWEFSHPSFQRGKKDLLFDIKRRVSTKTTPRKQEKDQQETIDEMAEKLERLESEVIRLQESNQNMASELMSCKQFIKEQRLAINQIIQYLGSGSTEGGTEGKPDPLSSFSFRDQNGAKKRKLDHNGADRHPNATRLDESITFDLPIKED